MLPALPVVHTALSSEHMLANIARPRKAREVLQDESNVQPVVWIPKHSIHNRGMHTDQIHVEMPSDGMWRYSRAVPRSDGTLSHWRAQP